MHSPQKLSNTRHNEKQKQKMSTLEAYGHLPKKLEGRLEVNLLIHVIACSGSLYFYNQMWWKLVSLFLEVP